MRRRLPPLFFLAAVLLAFPAIVAAAEPALTATVIPGQEIDVMGSGFPADADVLLVIERSGADGGSQTLRTDATGSFTATIDAGPGRGGVYTLIATSGSAKAVAEALAVETAGAGGTGGRQSPPPTDEAPNVPVRDAPANPTLPIVAVLVSLLIAAAYLRRRATPGVS